jgi:hypothetical protein
MTTTSELPVQEIHAALERMAQARAFADEHEAEYMAVYPDEYVAILGGKLIGHGPQAVTLIERLRAAGHDVAHVYLRFLPVKKMRDIHSVISGR